MEGTWFRTAMEFSESAFVKNIPYKKGLGRTWALFAVLGAFCCPYGVFCSESIVLKRRRRGLGRSLAEPTTFQCLSQCKINRVKFE